jgi:signal transduction histidine kinase
VFALLAAGALAAWAIPLYLLSLPLWGWAIGMGPVALVAAFVVGGATLGLAPRLVLLLGRGGARFAAAVLGPDRAEVMAARIDALTRQREEIVAAVAIERRRIERNLHDGVQQRLVALGIDLGMAAGRIHTDPDGAAALVAAAREQTRTAIGELRVLGRGLHPAILDDRGLDAALSAVVASSSVPLQLSVEPGIEVPIAVAETAYFVVNEAVTNTMKHADARSGSIRVTRRGDTLDVEVHDDGRGGADPGRGTGLAGMRARVQGADGSLIVTSPRGGPTIVRAQLPLPAAVPRPSTTGTGPVTGRSR